jgi:putative salt-induced outer membrane protein YdiY
MLISTLAHAESELSESNTSIKVGGSSDRSVTVFNSNISYSNISYSNISYSNKSYGDKSYGDKSYGNKSYGDKSYGDKSYGDKSRTSSYSEYIDFDSIYKNSNNRTVNDLYDVYGKINYNLPDDSKNYLQTSIRLQHNIGSHYHDIVVVGIGHGYRIIHTDTMKISIESSVAQAESIDDNENVTRLDQTILRESIWASYRLGHRGSISDKLLIERGGVIDYVKNIMSIEYNIEHDIYISLSHTWIRDEVNRGLINVTSVNLGVKF